VLAKAALTDWSAIRPPRARSIWSRSVTASICRGTAAHRALERPGLSRRRHLDVSRHLGSGDARRRRRGCRHRCGHVRHPMIMRSSRSARRAITPKTASRWAFVFSINAPSPPRHAQRKFGISRAAVVDFDVHHGNGTQDIFWADPTVMYCSTHQMPLFSGHRSPWRAREPTISSTAAGVGRRQRSPRAPVPGNTASGASSNTSRSDRPRIYPGCHCRDARRNRPRLRD